MGVLCLQRVLIHAERAAAGRSPGRGTPSAPQARPPERSGARGAPAFEDNKLALLIQEETASGERSNFNKLVSRESVTSR